MTLSEAKQILYDHNEWRRGNHDEATNTTKLGVAIEVILAYLNEMK